MERFCQEDRRGGECFLLMRAHPSGRPEDHGHSASLTRSGSCRQQHTDIGKRTFLPRPSGLFRVP